MVRAVNLEQVGLQLGIAGLMLVAGYRIALVLITNWRASEKERTEAYAKTESERTLAMASGFAAIGDKIERHAQADLQSHADMTKHVARFEGRLDAILDVQERTPIGAPPRPPEEQRRNTPPHGFYSLSPKKGG